MVSDFPLIRFQLIEAPHKDIQASQTRDTSVGKSSVALPSSLSSFSLVSTFQSVCPHCLISCYQKHHISLRLKNTTLRTFSEYSSCQIQQANLFSIRMSIRSSVHINRPSVHLSHKMHLCLFHDSSKRNVWRSIFFFAFHQKFSHVFL